MKGGRNLGALGSGSAAGVNGGLLGNQADKIVHLDPVNEILYDPAENIRNGKYVDDNIEGLIALRLTIEGSKQLQPIRVYLLPPEKRDPKKPAMKYGIAVGHRRTLCSRLTSADHPAISAMPRKVAAIIDSDWFKNGRSYQLRCQIHENTARLDLNPVELGQALLAYKKELAEEEKRTVPQRELMDVFGLPEKTVYLLLKAAEFHPIAKEVCHQKLLTDLDTLNTFDLTCKANEAMGQAIFESLKEEGAPSTRVLLRQARQLAESKDFVFDAKSWSWPGTVEKGAPKDTQTPGQAPVNAEVSQPQKVSTVDTQQNATAQEQQQEAQERAKPAPTKQGGATENVETNEGVGQHPQNGSEQQDGKGGNTNAGQESAPPTNQGKSQTQQPVKGAALAAGQAGVSVQAVIMVEFKMGEEATKLFTGELMVGHKPKAAHLGVVQYLNEEGREELIDVPLKLMKLVSINHP